MNPCYCCKDMELPLLWDKSLQQWICVNCSDDLLLGRKMVAYCVSCYREFFTNNESSPFVCNDCTPKDANMSVSKAMKVWKKCQPQRSFRERMDYASTAIKHLLGLGPYDVVMGRVKEMASRGGVSPKTVVDRYYKVQLAELAADEVVAVSREHGLGTYEAMMKDKANIETFELRTNYLKKYAISLGGTFCLESEDNSSGLPF